MWYLHQYTRATIGIKIFSWPLKSPWDLHNYDSHPISLDPFQTMEGTKCLHEDVKALIVFRGIRV